MVRKRSCVGQALRPSFPSNTLGSKESSKLKVTAWAPAARLNFAKEFEGANVPIGQRRFWLIRTIAGSGPLHYLEPDGANASVILSINRRTRFGWARVAG